MPLFYETIYKEFIDEELSAEYREQTGSKIQLAKVFPSFMANVFKKQQVSHFIDFDSTDETYKEIIDQYCHFFDQNQNKEVRNAAVEHCSEIIMQLSSGVQKTDSSQFYYNLQVTLYFDHMLKPSLAQLERHLTTNWRAHTVFFKA